MAKKLSSVLGIDIGSHKIKVAELKTQGKAPIINALGMIDTPEGAVDHTGVYNSDEVGAALKQLLIECGATTNHAIVSIAGQASVLVRTLEVPRMNPAELKEHMTWEINRNIPFAESDVMSDFRVLPDDDETSPNMEVVMAISPQSAITVLIECVSNAGKQLAAIDVEPLSIARTLTECHEEEYLGQTVCVVDLGLKTTAINIYRDGKLLMPRQVPVGGEMFTKALADARGISVEEAETVKLEKASIPASAASEGDTGFMAFDEPGATTSEPTVSGDAESFQPYNPFSDDQGGEDAGGAPESDASTAPDATSDAGGTGEAEPGPTIGSDEPTGEFEPFQPQADEGGLVAASGTPATTDDEVFNALSPILDEFLAEVRRSVDYYRSRGGDIDRILMCGGGTRMAGMSEYLTKSLGVVTEPYDPTTGILVNDRKVAPGYLEEHKQEFAIAIGNALHIFFD